MTTHDDDDRRLARALGGPAPAPRRSDDAFARAVTSEVRARKERPRAWAVSAWSAAGAAAALALFVGLMSPPAPNGDGADVDTAPLALTDVTLGEEDDLTGTEPLDEETLDALADDELVALHAALDEALSL